MAAQQLDGATVAGELFDQLRSRPYITLAGLVGVGWVLGRGVPLRALVAIAGVGARAAVATAFERGVRDHLRGPTRR